MPTEGEEGGEDLPRGKAPAAPAKVDRDERAKYNGTPAWWVGRGYEPTLAHLLVTNDVRPEEVRARAPKSISKLLSSEMPKPFGWRSGQIMASAVESDSLLQDRWCPALWMWQRAKHVAYLWLVQQL